MSNAAAKPKSAATGFIKPPIMTTASMFMLYVPKDRWQEAIHFYENEIGLTLRTSEDGWAEFGAGGVTFALHAADPAEFYPVATGIIFDVEDCAQAIEALKARGVRVDGAPVECGPGKRYFLFRDPFGNGLSGHGR